METNVLRSHNIGCGGERSVSPLIVTDLCAQLAPLNRYGLPGFSAAVAEGLRALMGSPAGTPRAVGEEAGRLAHVTRGH